MSDNDDWTARYNEASAAYGRMYAREKRARDPTVRAALKNARDDANAICCVMLRSYRGA